MSERVQLHGQRNLPQIVLTRSAAGCFARHHDGG
jgi:hypothetical protein